MYKKVSAWVLLLLLNMGMAWLIIAGVKCVLTDNYNTDRESLFHSAFGWEKADTLIEKSFPGAERAIELRTHLSIAVGNKRIGNVYINDERLLEEPDALDIGRLMETAGYINEFYHKYSVPTCLAAVPSASEIYTENLPEHVIVTSQLQQLDSFYEYTDTKIRVVDAYHVLSTFRDDYIFYRTDRKWTSYGAYCVYRSLISKMGYYPLSYDSFAITNVRSDFRGDLYEKCLYSKVVPDILDVYTCEDNRTITSMSTFDGTDWNECSLYNYDALENDGNVSFYMGGTEMFTRIETDAENEKKLLVIKDTLCDNMLPFLIQHYSQVDAVDITKLDRPVSELTDLSQYSQVLILCDADTLENAESFSFLIDKTDNGGNTVD